LIYQAYYQTVSISREKDAKCFEYLVLMTGFET
jgi:hypothetical protein